MTDSLFKFQGYLSSQTNLPILTFTQSRGVGWVTNFLWNNRYNYHVSKINSRWRCKGHCSSGTSST